MAIAIDGFSGDRYRIMLGRFSKPTRSRIDAVASGRWQVCVGQSPGANPFVRRKFHSGSLLQKLSGAPPRYPGRVACAAAQLSLKFDEASIGRYREIVNSLHRNPVRLGQNWPFANPVSMSGQGLPLKIQQFLHRIFLHRNSAVVLATPVDEEHRQRLGDRSDLGNRDKFVRSNGPWQRPPAHTSGTESRRN